MNTVLAEPFKGARCPVGVTVDLNSIRHIDRDDFNVAQIMEIGLDRAEDVIAKEVAVVEHDSDPAALRAIDTGDTHAAIVWPARRAASASAL